jgi:excisionase family DNA binding protein
MKIRGFDSPQTAKPTVSVNQAMEHCGVSRRTIYNWMKDGKIDYTENAGGRKRIVFETLWKRDDAEPTR